LAIAAIIGGFLIGGSGGGGSDEPEAPEGQSSATSGAVTLSYPNTWQRVNAGAGGPEGSPALPGFEFTNPIAAGPAGPAGNGRMVAGIVDASGASLLPAGFVDALGADPDRTDTVKLGDYQAYRYKNLDPGGFEPQLTLYVVPTDKGVVTIACEADAAQAATFLPECEKAASTLTLDGAEPYELGPGKEYVTTLNSTIDEVQGARDSGVKALKSAKTPAQQEKAAAGIADAYDAAAKALAEAPASPQVADANDTLVAALQEAADAWGQVEKGAGDADRRDYLAGGRAVKKADKKIEQALEALGRTSAS
jgi:hypothetical protein